MDRTPPVLTQGNDEVCTDADHFQDQALSLEGKGLENLGCHWLAVEVVLCALLLKGDLL